MTKTDVEELVDHAPRQVTSYFDIRIYPKGSSILVSGAKNSSLYLLLKGTAEVYQYILNGMFISLYRYDKSGCFGEIELYCENRTTLGVPAADTCRIVKLSRKGVETWIREGNGFYEFLLYQMALKIAEDLDTYIRSPSMGLEDHVSHCLCRYDRMGTSSGLAKERLMDEVCTPIHNLNRVLVQYREEGFVAYDKHRFRTADEERSLDAADKLVGSQR